METNEGSGRDLRMRVDVLESKVQALQARLDRVEGKAEEPRVHDGAFAPGATPAPPVQERAVAPPPLPRTEAPRPSPVITPLPPAQRTAVVPPRMAQPSPPPIPREPSAASQLLHALHLVPPAGGGSGEVQLGAWWATRVGALLLLLAVVFFGVYVSIDTPPWVKLAELAAVSVAVTGAGAWLAKRFARFGATVLGTGLAMLYFTAFASYAVPAVKVTDSILVAAVLQAAAVTLVFGVAIKRDSATTATMATLLGFVSAFSSIAEGFDDFAVFGGLALASIAVLLRRWRGWGAPLLSAVVLQHGIVAAVAMSVWDTELGQRSAPYVFGVVGASFLVFFVSLLFERPDANGRVARAQHWAQALNGSLGAIAGLVAANTVLGNGDVSYYFFGAGLVLVCAALWTWRRLPDDPLFGAFAVKASALVALGAMTQWGERTRWIALLVEAFVLLAAAKRTRKAVLTFAAVAAWGVSLIFFLSDVDRLAGNLVSGGGVAVLVFTLAGPLFLALAVRDGTTKTGESTSGSSLAIGVVAALPAWMACSLAMGTAWGPVAMASLFAGLCALAWALRSLVPAAAALVCFLWAHAALHSYSEFVHGLQWLWLSAALVAALTAACGWRAFEFRHGAAAERRTSWELFEAGMMALALAALFAAVFRTWPANVGLAVAIGASAALSWIGATAKRPAWIAGGVAASVIALAMFARERTGDFGVADDAFWLWLAAFFGVLLLLARPADRSEAAETSASTRSLAWIAAIVSTILSWVAIEAEFGVVGQSWAALVALVVYGVLAVRFRIGGAFAAVTLVGLLGMFAVATSGSWPPAQASWSALAAAWSLGCAFVVLPAAAGQCAPWISSGAANAWRLVHACIGTLFVLSMALARPAPWESLTTIVWALAGIVFFVAGLFLRARSHRITGLIVLALCIPRMFLVDINSTLYRIAAFVVLGVVLLWVGFSYQRFRHFIDGGSNVDVDAPKKME